MVAEAVKLGPERLELLLLISRLAVDTVVPHRTSSARLGWGASSLFISIFCFRLSLLAARAGFSPSPSFEAERVAVGVAPRAAREFDDDMACGCEPVAACEGVLDEAMDEDEFLERAVGGVGEARLSIWGGGALLLFSHTTAAARGKTEHLLTWDFALVENDYGWPWLCMQERAY